MKTVVFYFDLGSPYSYLGFQQIQKIADQTQACILWKPILLGAVFKETGNHSPMMVPAKARYSQMDLQRWSQYWHIPLQMNPNFPINTLSLMRLVTAVQLYLPERWLKITANLFDAMFKNPKNLNDPAVFMQLVQDMGLEVEQVNTWLNDEKVKAQLKDMTREAIERGVFGAPTWFVENEMFWGIDHLHFVQEALS